MKKNESILDRAIRFILSVALALLVIFKVVTGIPAIIISVLAVILFLTALIGYCGLYSLLGISTCKDKC
jgi:hypothetical protein